MRYHITINVDEDALEKLQIPEDHKNHAITLGRELTAVLEWDSAAAVKWIHVISQLDNDFKAQEYTAAASGELGPERVILP